MAVLKLKDGGVLELKVVFNQYFHALMLFANRYLGCLDESESLVQDVFIDLYENRREFINQQAMKSWLYTVVRNKALDVLKHRRIESGYADAVIEEKENEVYYMKSLIEEETRRILLTAIESLPKHCQDVCLLNLEGLDNQEIADAMGVSVDTVKFHKKNAYRLLREKLGGYFYLLPFLIGF